MKNIQLTASTIKISNYNESTNSLQGLGFNANISKPNRVACCSCFASLHLQMLSSVEKQEQSILLSAVEVPVN